MAFDHTQTLDDTEGRIKESTSRQTRSPRRLGLHVTLRHIEPPIWREITVPDSYSLLQPDRCIQLVFGWLDYHLFEFHIGDRTFEAPDSEAEGERADLVRLRDLDLSSKSSFLYLYDMRDYWEHDIGVRSILAESAAESPDVCAYLIFVDAFS